jgi:hypothetical protein
VYEAGEPDLFPMFTGQGVRMLKEQLPAATIVEQLVAEANAALRRSA